MFDCLKGDKELLTLSIPLSEGRLLALLQNSATVLEEKYEGPVAEVLVLVPRCEPYRISS